MSVNPSPKAASAICPGCGTKIRLSQQIELGQFLICAECGDELEVVQLSPLKLDWAFEDPFDDAIDDQDLNGDFDYDYNDEDYYEDYRYSSSERWDN
jgi:lysine biosynthesis protein LysW